MLQILRIFSLSPKLDDITLDCTVVGHEIRNSVAVANSGCFLLFSRLVSS